MKKVAVLGASGQDGSILCEEFVRLGWNVLGIGRRAEYPYAISRECFSYRSLDLGKADELAQVLHAWQPDEVYHVAAVHGSAGFEYERLWGQALDVNVKSLHTVLEYARVRNAGTRIFYASSAKIFGTPLRGTIALDTPQTGNCLYAITKKAAGSLAAHYRVHHNIPITVGILFNHESDRRTPDFFIPRLCRIVRESVVDPTFKAKLRTLSFHCDWSSARDLMQMAIAALESNVSGELLFASGVTWNGEDFARELFSRYGLDYTAHVEVDVSGSTDVFSVDTSETDKQLAYVRTETVFDICDKLIQSHPSVKK